MFSPRTPSTRTRSSPYTPSGINPRTQNKRVSNLFTPKGRQSYTTKAHTNRSLQTSQLIEETEGYRIDGLGTPLPVLITEALALADKHTEITVKIDPSGWAWLVGGRKLFVWRYKGGQSVRTVFCKELTLPPSDLAHNADRVCVIPNVTDKQSASCIAVSPEGVVRYWPNIAYEGSSTEISAELRGDECACVVNFEPFGCLLATTTSSLVLLSPVLGQNTLTCHPLKGSQGMFSGIGRRMSSFIFGASTLQPSGAPLQAIVCGTCEDEDERPFYVLSGTQFQKWNLSQAVTEKLFYQIDVERMFREFLSKKVWNQDSRQLTQLKTWLLDMRTTQQGVVFLGAGVNMDVDLTVHFGLAFLDTDINGTPSELESLMILDHQDTYSDDFEYSLQKYKLLLADPMTTTAYVYNRDHVLFIPGPSTEVINLQQPGGHILGAGSCDGTGVFFSGSMGLFSISSPQKQEVSIMEEPSQDMTTADMSVLTASHAKMQELSMSEDRTARLKSAFIATMRGNIAAAQSTIDELFPPDEVSTDLDQTVVALDKDLVNDFPAADPRWAESRQDATSSTTSLIIINQLNDKLRAHEYVINFLKKMNLWKQLNQVNVRDTRMLTRHVMCEHAEKLQAAIALRQLHVEFTGIVDAAIKKVLEMRRDVNISLNLTPQDVFYREVSRIQEVVECLLEHQEEVLLADVTVTEILTVITSINTLLEDILHKALQYRQTKSSMYDCEAPPGEVPEYVPWTSTSGDHGIRTFLLKQFNKTMEIVIPEVRDPESQEKIYQQLASIADIILDGYVSQLESLKNNVSKQQHYNELQRRYEQDRQQLILPMMKGKQYELAASLAEKYYDFEILIQLCELSDNKERIEKYLHQFSHKGFANYLYTWYMKEGKRGRLLALPVGQQRELGRFLQKEDIKTLSWLHNIQTNNFSKAHSTLLELARIEQDSLAKKKTLLSLSKLSGLAADPDNGEIDSNILDINEEQELIAHQQQLPALVIENLGMEPNNMTVLSPVQLIELYISGTNIDATEYDFKKALDLLQYIDKTDPALDFESLRMHIWAQSILRDSWQQDESVDVMETVMNTVFFKTVDLAYKEDTRLTIGVTGQ
ncbi:nuclear pore complex protein Nup133-like isoform X3 [Ostrea edulis]|uniref:nuclear pore complex protein Nup133-like isoform X3 n=1 Tax=Ostrea edulis TaxID=37623 RepID=UPI0024AEC291|nr:nuclear pore complex protein Nup133-like isoform X3 [Ostrea edulis]